MPTTARGIVHAACRMQSLSVMGGVEGGGAGWPTMRFASASIYCSIFDRSLKLEAPKAVLLPRLLAEVSLTTCRFAREAIEHRQGEGQSGTFAEEFSCDRMCGFGTWFGIRPSASPSSLSSPLAPDYRLHHGDVRGDAREARPGALATARLPSSSTRPSSDHRPSSRT